MTRIAFIGLGHMGLPMATHLSQSGHAVTGFDLQASARHAFAANGGVCGSSLQELAGTQEIIITMLQTGEQVQSVCLGEQGLFAHAKPQALYIDCSSIDVPTSRAIHEAASTYQLMSVDAPVSGGVAGAVAASLTFMVGGTAAAFLQAKPILSLMGKKIIHAGIAGNGQAAKICNNMILGISMIAISEAFVLAAHLGLDAKKLFEVVTHASGQCWAMDKYVPIPGILNNVPADHDYQPGFTAAMMLKDLKLSQHAAATSGVKTTLAEKATNLYQALSDAGMSQLDFSAIIKMIE